MRAAVCTDVGGVCGLHCGVAAVVIAIVWMLYFVALCCACWAAGVCECGCGAANGVAGCCLIGI